MYLGVILMLFGESIFFQSAGIFAYTILVVFLFRFFIIKFEEPRLKKDFGKAYEKYCETVKRWI
jgi:protein-S-isoprenylcysteine O-methyltransferase Ste14